MDEERLPVPEYDVVAMDEIAPDIRGLRILFVNVYGVAHPDGSWTLIDAGLPLSAARIRHWAEHSFGRPPRAIVLTHGHFDHVGAVKELADGWDVPVYAHELEHPFVNGSKKYPPPDPAVGGGMMARLSPLYPRSPVDISHRLRALPADGSVADLPGWRAVHTPGHTVGHVSFFREGDRALLVGDAFCTVQAESLFAIATQRPELHGPPAYYTPNWDEAKASVQRLAQLQPTLLIPGHGTPIGGADVPQRLDTLARDFDRTARPEPPHDKRAAGA